MGLVDNIALQLSIWDTVSEYRTCMCVSGLSSYHPDILCPKQFIDPDTHLHKFYSIWISIAKIHGVGSIWSPVVIVDHINSWLLFTGWSWGLQICYKDFLSGCFLRSSGLWHDGKINILEYSKLDRRCQAKFRKP